jgi:hypothetical protein
VIRDSKSTRSIWPPPNKFATLALAVLLAAPPAAVHAAMSCNTVYSTLMPCLPFVQTGGNLPPPTCCSGIRSLLSQAGTTPDRRTISGCLKNVAASSDYISRAAHQVRRQPALQDQRRRQLQHVRTCTHAANSVVRFLLASTTWYCFLLQWRLCALGF